MRRPNPAVYERVENAFPYRQAINAGGAALHGSLETETKASRAGRLLTTFAQDALKI